MATHLVLVSVMWFGAAMQRQASCVNILMSLFVIDTLLNLQQMVLQEAKERVQ
jgi:hypothetical protein